MAGHALTVRGHDVNHHPRLSVPSVRIPALCLQCALERLEGEFEPLALRKFIVDELASIVEGGGAGVLEVLQEHGDFLERLLLSVTGQLCSENEALQESAVNVCIHLAQQDSSQGCLRCLVERTSEVLCERLPAASCLPFAILLGRLLHNSSHVATSPIWGDFQKVACQSLLLVSPPLQSALMYLLVQQWQTKEQQHQQPQRQDQEPEPGGTAIFHTALKQLVRVLRPPSCSLDLLMNGFGLLKCILSNCIRSSSDLPVRNDDGAAWDQATVTSVVEVVKKGLVNSDALLQATAAQCCCLLASQEHIAERCLKSDMAEFLMEALASKHDIITREVLAALCQLTRHKAFFTGHHSVYALEPVAEAMEKVKSPDLQLHGLDIINSILSRNPPSIRLMTGVGMFRRLHGQLALLACSDVPGTEGEVGNVTQCIQAQAWLALSHLWSVKHLPYDWPDESMQEFLAIVRRHTADEPEVGTPAGCQQLAEVFKSLDGVVRLLNDLQEVIPEETLSVYLEQISAVAASVLANDLYHQVCTSSEEGVTLVEHVLDVFIAMLASEHVLFITLPLSLADSQFFPTALGCLSVRSSRSAWMFVEAVCKGVAEFHAGLMGYETADTTVNAQFLALSKHRPNCTAADMLLLLGAGGGYEHGMQAAWDAVLTILSTALLHGHRLASGGDLCDALTSFVLRCPSLRLLSDSVWRQLLLVVSSLQDEPFTPNPQWPKAWQVMTRALGEVATTLQSVFSPGVGFLTWMFSAELPEALRGLAWQGCLSMLCKYDDLSEGHHRIQQYCSKEDISEIIASTQPALPSLLDVMAQGTEDVVAMACGLLADAMAQPQTRPWDLAMAQPQTRPWDLAVQEMESWDVGEETVAVAANIPGRGQHRAASRLSIAELPNQLEAILQGHRVEPHSNHTYQAVVHLLCVHQRQQLEGHIDSSIDRLSTKLICSVLGMIERCGHEISSPKSGVTGALPLDSSSSRGGGSSDSGTCLLLGELLAYLTVVAACSWKQGSPQAASILLSNNSLGRLIETLVVNAAGSSPTPEDLSLAASSLSLLTQLIYCDVTLGLQGRWSVELDIGMVMPFLASKHLNLTASTALLCASFLQCQSPDDHRLLTCCHIAGFELSTDLAISRHDSKIQPANTLVAFTLLLTRLLMQDQAVCMCAGAVTLHAFTRALDRCSSVGNSDALDRWTSSPWLLHALRTKAELLVDASDVQTSAALLLAVLSLPEKWQKELSVGDSKHTLDKCVRTVSQSLSGSQLNGSPQQEHSHMDIDATEGHKDGANSVYFPDVDACSLSWFIRAYSKSKSDANSGEHDYGSARSHSQSTPTASRWHAELDGVMQARLSLRHCRVIYVGATPVILDSPPVS